MDNKFVWILALEILQGIIVLVTWSLTFGIIIYHHFVEKMSGNLFIGYKSVKLNNWKNDWIAILKEKE